MADNEYIEEDENTGSTPEEEEDEKEEAGSNGSMVELQILNYVLDNDKWDFIKKNALDETYFPGYGEEYEFIKNHVTKYNVSPDISTFLAKFPDFDLFEIQESEQAMLEAIKEEKAYSLIAPTLNEVNRAAAQNAIEAAQLMKEKAETILKEVNIIRFKPGYDIFKMAHERAETYVKRLGLQGILGCVSNIPKLDEATHGWLDEDFVALVGRIQQGKSWISEYLGLMPWLMQQKKVGLWTLENSKEITGFRADTLLRHFSNDGLVSGKEVLGWENMRPRLTKDDYLEYIQQAAHFDTPFLVYDNTDAPTDAGWSIEEIEEVAELENFDLILIDQLSLLRVLPRVKSIREGYVHTTRYIRKMVNRRKKPVILNAQAGREAAKALTKDKESTPELHQIAESDSVGQDATKMLSLVNLDGLLKLSLKKNTLGRSGIDVLMKWKIDTGELEPLSLEDGDPNPESNF